MKALKRLASQVLWRKLGRKLTGSSWRRRGRGRRRRAGGRLSLGLLLLLAIGGGGYYLLESEIRQNHAFAGVPEVQNWQDWQTWHRVLRNDGFMVGYSDWRMSPLWVTYPLEAVPDRPIGSRPSHFPQDWRTLPVWRSSHDDYTSSGYDRGHLAPNYAIARVHGREAQLQTFLMTNISPQTPELNRRVWQRIEEAAMDHFVPLKKEVWVITGPVFGSATQRLESSWKVQIPEAFYKIFVAPPRGDRPLKVLAFLVPQTVNGNEPLDRFLVTVRDIEQLTGLDFMPELPTEVAERVATRIHPGPWRLGAVNTLPGRYQ